MVVELLTVDEYLWSYHQMNYMMNEYKTKNDQNISANNSISTCSDISMFMTIFI